MSDGGNEEREGMNIAGAVIVSHSIDDTAIVCFGDWGRCAISGRGLVLVGWRDVWMAIMLV